MTTIEQARKIVAWRAANDGEPVFAREVLAGAWDHRNDVQAALRGDQLKNAGESWLNPYWYGDWRIYLSTCTTARENIAYVHDDYDGAEDAHDNRHGYAASIEAAKLEIDELVSFQLGRNLD